MLRAIPDWIALKDSDPLRAEARAESYATHTPLYYEILLHPTAHGERTLPTRDLISVAERLQRITEIDRWVVRNVLQWMRDHTNLVDRLGGLSINLSGQSITYPLFLKLLLADLSRGDILWEHLNVVEAPMFVRAKKSGPYQYLQIVETRREGSKVVQRVISTIGRLDRLNDKGDIESLVRSLSRFSEQALLVLSGKSELLAEARKVGPALIFERLWDELGIGKVIKELLAGRFFSFDVERAIFLTVLHRLMVSGSDSFCEKWRRDYLIRGVDDLSLHHLYRAMAFLGEARKPAS